MASNRSSCLATLQVPSTRWAPQPEAAWRRRHKPHLLVSAMVELRKPDHTRDQNNRTRSLRRSSPWERMPVFRWPKGILRMLVCKHYWARDQRRPRVDADILIWQRTCRMNADGRTMRTLIQIKNSLAGLRRRWTTRPDAKSRWCQVSARGRLVSLEENPHRSRIRRLDLRVSKARLGPRIRTSLALLLLMQLRSRLPPSHLLTTMRN